MVEAVGALDGPFEREVSGQEHVWAIRRDDQEPPGRQGPIPGTSVSADSTSASVIRANRRRSGVRRRSVPRWREGSRPCGWTCRSRGGPVGRRRAARPVSAVALELPFEAREDGPRRAYRGSCWPMAWKMSVPNASRCGLGSPTARAEIRARVDGRASVGSAVEGTRGLRDRRGQLGLGVRTQERVRRRSSDRSFRCGQQDSRSWRSAFTLRPPAVPGGR
jgi:hypothetical protein